MQGTLIPHYLLLQPLELWLALRITPDSELRDLSWWGLGGRMWFLGIKSSLGVYCTYSLYFLALKTFAFKLIAALSFFLRARVPQECTGVMHLSH